VGTGIVSIRLRKRDWGLLAQLETLNGEVFTEVTRVLLRLALTLEVE
jgi:hypothetical protein